MHILPLLLASALAPAHVNALPHALDLLLTPPALAHDADTEAEEMRQARQKEKRERAAYAQQEFLQRSLQDAIDLLPEAEQVSGTTSANKPIPVPGKPGAPLPGKPEPKPLPVPPPQPLACRYHSDIAAPPPPMRVALTFDDGPDQNGTPYILEVLAKYNIYATFFMIGQSAQKYPDLVKRVVSAGHLLVGNHSWSHPDFHKIPVAQQLEEAQLNENLIGKFEKPMFFRYPYGDSTCEADAYVHKLGYKIVGWHVDSCDWAFNKTGAIDDKDAQTCEVRPQFKANFVGHVVDQLHAHKGGILLMHEIQPNTIKQLEVIVQNLIHDGFTFGTIDEAGFAPSMK